MEHQTPAPGWRVRAGLGLVCAAVLVFQVALTRIFSFLTWLHLTFLAISVALLGFGASGTYLAVRDDGLAAGARPAGYLGAARIPVKVSCVVNEHNVGEIDSFLAECRTIGVRRVVLRRLYGETRTWDILRDLPVVGAFRGNPVMSHDGMEVTYWDFDESRCRSINLFADGTLGTSYLLTETPQVRPLALPARSEALAASEPGATG